MPPTSSPAAAGLADRLAQQLRQRIIDGDLASGRPLRESTLATEYGASRNTVREAFRILAHDRLVTHEANRGVTVRTLRADDVRDLYAVRLALEPLGLAVVDPDVLGASVEDAREAAASGDWGNVSTGDLRFHQVIVAALGSRRFDEMFVTVLAELRLAFARMPDERSFHVPYLERNLRIVDLLRAGDREGAAAELTDYLATARDQLCAVVGV